MGHYNQRQCQCILRVNHMWDYYNDDDFFQKMAREKVTHDAELLAKVLYGKEVRNRKNPLERKNKEENGSKTKGSVKFCQEEGKFSVDKSLLEEVEEEGSTLVSRGKDHSFLPVKELEDFQEGVKTDVVVFDRKTSSEYEEERKELKDNLVAWQERYNARRQSAEETD